MENSFLDKYDSSEKNIDPDEDGFTSEFEEKTKCPPNIHQIWIYEENSDGIGTDGYGIHPKRIISNLNTCSFNPDENFWGTDFIYNQLYDWDLTPYKGLDPYGDPDNDGFTTLLELIILKTEPLIPNRMKFVTLKNQ